MGLAAWGWRRGGGGVGAGGGDGGRGDEVLLMMLLLRKEGSYFVPSLCVPLGHPRSVSGRVGRLYVGV